MLKGQIGFTGFVMSDFGALHDTLKGLAAGDDMETGTTTVYDGALLAAVQSGQASLALVNDAVLRILTTCSASASSTPTTHRRRSRWQRTARWRARSSARRSRC